MGSPQLQQLLEQQKALAKSASQAKSPQELRSVMAAINTHRELVARLSKAAQARGLAIDYRLAPENPFPAAVDDSITAYRWLLAQGYKPERIVIAGDSAGGGLAVSTLLALRDLGASLPAAAVCISPWVDFEAE